LKLDPYPIQDYILIVYYSYYRAVATAAATAALAAALFDPSLTMLVVDVHRIVTCV